MAIQLFASLFFFDLLFQAGQNAEVAKSGLFESLIDFLNSLLGGAFFLSLFGLALYALGIDIILENAGVGNDDFLVFLGELDNLEVKGLTLAGFALVLFLKMTHGSETFNTVGKSNSGTLVVDVGDSALLDAANGKERFVNIPRILLELLVTEAETTVFGIDFENNNLNGVTNLGELGRMLNLLAPAQVADMDEAVNTFFKFNKDKRYRSW